MMYHDNDIIFYIQSEPNSFLAYWLGEGDGEIHTKFQKMNNSDGLSSVFLCEVLNKYIIAFRSRIKLYTREEFIDHFGTWLPF